MPHGIERRFDEVDRIGLVVRLGQQIPDAGQFDDGAYRSTGDNPRARCGGNEDDFRPAEASRGFMGNGSR